MNSFKGYGQIMSWSNVDLINIAQGLWKHTPLENSHISDCLTLVYLSSQHHERVRCPSDISTNKVNWRESRAEIKQASGEAWSPHVLRSPGTAHWYLVQKLNTIKKNVAEGLSGGLERGKIYSAKIIF